jgi:hypothetical protein
LKYKVKVQLPVACRGGRGEGDFSNGLTYKRHKTAHALYACTEYTIFHGTVYFPDPVEDIRNPLNNAYKKREIPDACRGRTTNPKIKINQK